MPLRGPGAGRQKAAQATLSHGPKRRLPWKRKGLSKAEQVIAFLEWLPVTKGRLRGKRMRLLPAQREFIHNAFAADRRGKPVVSLAILSEPKGNGKSGLVAGICLAALLGPLSEERGAVYAASIDRGKAGILYEEIVAIIERVPEFEARVNVQDFVKKIHVNAPGDGYDSTFEALSADARRSQGLSPTLWAYDEAGEAPDDALLKVLLESEGKRDHTLGIVLSTQADTDDHFLSKLIDHAQISDDPSIYLQLHAAPVDADPWSEETIRLANPAFGTFLDATAVLKSRDRARAMPAFEPSYRRLRLNQRADSKPEDRLIQVAQWKALGAPVSREALKGRKCFGGLDLSGKHDLTAFVLVFPSDDPDPIFDVLPVFWTPRGALESRAEKEARQFRHWIDAGHMVAIDGPTIRYAHVAHELAKLAEEFEILSVGFDRWRIDDLTPELAEYGAEVPLEPFGQGYQSMGPAIEWFSELALSGKVRHGGHPVLTAAASNAITSSDPAGNLKIEKPKSNTRGPVRVDGAVALVMALQVAGRYRPTPPKPSLAGFLKKPVMSL